VASKADFELKAEPDRNVSAANGEETQEDD
jgi:hypothetical protein